MVTIEEICIIILMAMKKIIQLSKYMKYESYPGQMENHVFF